ncbi:hypothetical protein Tco_0959237 [Tanacetum coccineum]
MWIFVFCRKVKDVQCNLFQVEEVADQFVKHFNNFLGIEVPVKDFGPFLPLINKKLSPTDADFMKAWDIVGKDVCKYVKEFFDNGKMLKEINSTLITLIPKIETPDKVPLFLIGIYKIIFCFLKNFSKDMIGKKAQGG